jgi:quinol monooxygenase YgiN
MELVIIARFHAREAEEAAVSAALVEQIAYVRQFELDCSFIDAYSSTRNTRLFWIYSRWRDEAAFDIHAELPNTRCFVQKMEKLIDHPFDATRALSITQDRNPGEIC